MAHPERRERVHDRVDDRGRRHAGAALADAFDAQRVEGRRRHGPIHHQLGHVVGPRDRVFHERAREQLTVLAVGDALQ